MMDRAQAQTVTREREAFDLEVADDVCRVEQTQLAQAANRTSAVIGGHHSTAKPCLVEPGARLTNCISAFDRILEFDGLGLVDRAGSSTWGHDHAPRNRIVAAHKAWE